MTSRPRRLSGCAALMLLAAAVQGEAQTVELRGRGDLETDTMLERILAAGDYRLLVRDTVVAPADTLVGHILVVGATVRFENVIRGDLTLIDGIVFLRPGGRITGQVQNIGGGFFLAPGATVDGHILDLPDAPYRAETDQDPVLVRGTRVPALVDPAGLWGLLLPAYDRVNGLGLHGGIRFLLPRIGRTEPELTIRADYHEARERGGGGLDLVLRTLSGWYAGVGVERVATSRDTWMRTDLANSAAFLTYGQDLRNYYDAERAYTSVGLDIEHGSGSAAFALRAQREDALSLPARNPWHAWGDDPARPNPGIDEGRVTSLQLDAAADWSRPTFEASVAASVERASRSAGDFSFTAFEIAGTWTMQALADHTYALDARFRGPLKAGQTLPRQRWSALGGGSPLPTLDDLELEGDRLVFFSSEYAIPLRGILLPALGSPAIELIHHFGTAWSTDFEGGTVSGSRDLTHNLGLRLRFRLAWIMGSFDPEDRGSFKVTAGFARAPWYPWTPREDR